MPFRRIRDRRTGETYDMPWDSPEPPSTEQIRSFIDSQVFKPKKSLWERANEPLTDLPSRLGRSISSGVSNLRRSTSNPYLSRLSGFAEGAIEGVGDTISGFTSPLSLGATALTLGAGGAARAGLGAGSRALTNTARGIGLATAGHGAYRVGEGAYEGDYGKMGAGALEIAGGVLGARTPYPKAPTPAVPPRPAPKLLTTRIPEQNFERPTSTRFYQGTEGIADAKARYRTHTGPENNIDFIGEKSPTVTAADLGEFTDVPPMYAAENGFNRTLGRPRWNQVPEERGNFGNFDSSDLVALGRKSQAASEMGARKDAPAFASQMKYAGRATTKPLGDIDTGAKGTKLPQQPSEARMTELVSKKGGKGSDVAPGGTYSKMSEANLKAAAQAGSKAAAMELRRRGGESGAVTLDFLTGGFLSKKPVTPPDPKKLSFDTNFADWVNKRHATKVEGRLKSREFQGLDSEGLQGIFKFQQGTRAGLFNDVKSYFDKKHQELTGAGVKLGFKENYLPQLWQNSPEEVLSVSARLGLKPSFTMESVIENYEKGIAAGLKPKFNKISELIGWYEGRANKAIADRQFFDWLQNENLIRAKKGTIPGWESLNPDHFPVYKFSGGKEVTYVAPKDVARAINNYLTVPPSEFDFRNPGAMLQKIADLASYSKNFALSSGIPGTAINAHGFNIVARNMMAKGPIKGGVEALKWMVNPGKHDKQSIPIGKGIEKITPWKSAGTWLDENLDKAPEAVRNGLMLSSEGHELGTIGSTNLVGKVLHGVAEKHGKYFEDPMFQNVIPALKLKYYGEFKAELVKKGLNDGQAGRVAANAANEAYGGINTEALQRSRDFQNLARALVLAPDWLESNLKIGGGLAKTLLDPKTPQGEFYGKVAKNLLGAYIAANAINMASTGRPMWENPPGRALSVYMGKSGDKDRYFNPFGTAADFARLPVEMLASAFQGDASSVFKIARNRMSIPARTAGNLTFNVDDFSRPIYGKDPYGRKIPIKQQVGGIATQLASPITPPYVAALGDLASGRLNAEQTVMSGAEMPMRYYTRPRPRGRSRRRLQ